MRKLNANFAFVCMAILSSCTQSASVIIPASQLEQANNNGSLYYFVSPIVAASSKELQKRVPETGGNFHRIDLSSATLEAKIGFDMGFGPTAIKVCEPTEGYWCAQLETGEGTIGIPKKIQGDQWSYDGLDYQIVDRLQGSSCVPDMIIMGKKDGEPYRSIVYSAVSGLKAFILIDSKPLSVNGRTGQPYPSYRDIWFVSPAGMWANTSC